ncbi:lipid scramblase CLPTM1L-like [Anguilla rostrata]|uniref:lipid scramblase CLPTM1L-like n=1 Tax=Anguilla rostrata TaxID=7938 RepID=UPI0030D26912
MTMFPACYSKSPNGVFRKTSFTTLIAGVFVLYVLHTCWVIYSILYTRPCGHNKRENCIVSYMTEAPRLQLSIYTSVKPSEDDGHSLILKMEDFDIHSSFERTLNVFLPLKTRSNGTLYILVFLHQAGVSPWQDSRQVNHVAPLTTYMLPKAPKIRFTSDQAPLQLEEQQKHLDDSAANQRPVSHWHSRLSFNVVAEDFSFDQGALPSDVQRYLRVFQDGKKTMYLPILFINELRNRVKDLMVMNSTTANLPLTISYHSISLGKLRFWIHMQDAVHSLRYFGFTEQDTDEMKGIFVDTNLYFLALTVLVAAFHLLFDLLAFKNDISFWKKKKTMVGMSSKAVLWRCFSTIVIFLYLLEEQTNLLVLFPAGVGSVIEVWKVMKAYRIQVLWSGMKPIFLFGNSSESEKKTEEHDTQAMKYLSFLLYPLCFGGAIYSLIYVKYKSWYSWLINSLVIGIYGFGFLFIIPQLFVNYKLKSVAHLPWKALKYKAFNTFIDDIFAFIITMPTTHWLACFRDDLVFLIYLYQRWLYPVDKTRVNEHRVFHSQKAKGKTHKD